MPEYRYEGKPLSLGACVMALGVFDGVHLGHRALIGKARELAERAGLPLSVFTFEPEPELKDGASLYTGEVKAELLTSLGADNIIVASFGELSGMSARDFIDTVLVSHLSVRIAVTGDDFRFGHGREGDVRLLSERLRESGREHVICPAVLAGDGGEKISSAMIKACLAEGDVRGAATLLGSPYFISSKVEHGLGLGRKLGTPTVNMSLHCGASALLPGVYCSRVVTDGGEYTGITNIGTCPTFGERECHAETFILDFDAPLYGEKIKLYLIEYLRPERRFSSPEELTAQIMRDAERAREITKE